MHAKELYEKALESANESESGGLTTVMYNVARLYESLGDVEVANKTYQEILDRHPSYIDGGFAVC
jgi:tetratricopeptide (TPR) repeat protein